MTDADWIERACDEALEPNVLPTVLRPQYDVYAQLWTGAWILIATTMLESDARRYYYAIQRSRRLCGRRMIVRQELVAGDDGSTTLFKPKEASMRNIITDGPLDAPTPNDAPNPSNLDSITNAEKAQSIDGHDVILRVPMSELNKR